MTNAKRIVWFVLGLFLGGAIAVGSDAMAATAKPAPKIDCSAKKNASKLECKAAPTSKVKPKVKKPKKVDRKAPADVKKKADQKTGGK